MPVYITCIHTFSQPVDNIKICKFGVESEVLIFFSDLISISRYIIMKLVLLTE